MRRRTRDDITLFDRRLVGAAASAALQALVPWRPARHPVRLVLEVVAVAATLLFLASYLGGGGGGGGGGAAGFIGQVAAWLWLGVFLLSFAEAVAEARGRGRADRLRLIQHEVPAKLLVLPHDRTANWLYETVPSRFLRTGAVILVEPGDTIPADGEVIEGTASVDESAITGESAPVIRESGGDRSAVIGGTRVLSDWLKVRVTVEEGGSFYDQVIGLIETARRRTTRRELKLAAPLIVLAVLATIALAAAQPFQGPPSGLALAILVVALLAALLPTAPAGLLSALGIAGMDRLVAANLIAKSGAAVEAAAGIDTLLLDKTGTITLGGRRAAGFAPLPGVTEAALIEAALLASLGDGTSEGRSILELARERSAPVPDPGRIRTVVPYSAETRMSGARLEGGGEVHKGAMDAVLALAGVAADETAELRRIVDGIARTGGTPLVVSRDGRPLGVVHLKDAIRPGLRERFAELRRIGIRTVMVTGDNPLTAATIAAEAGVDDFVAQATPAAKLKLIRAEQAKSRLVAMCGDGTNDAPALAQADVGIAMSQGTSAAREAGNMIDLDSDPLKLLEVVRVGRQLRASYLSLATFSLGSEAAKYLAVVPVALATSFPRLAGFNLLGLATTRSAVLATVICHALVILALIPLALHGVRHPALGDAGMRRHHLPLYGLVSILACLIGIKLLDSAITAIGLV